MNYILIIREDALFETSEAYRYYEDLQAELGERFLVELKERYIQICEHPQYYGFIDSQNTLRDVKVKKFPYQIIFEIIGNTVIVYSVFNSYQKPFKRNK